MTLSVLTVYLAVATLTLVLAVGLTFLHRPSQVTAIWSSGFALAMLSGYFWLGFELTTSTVLLALGTGMFCSLPGFFWLGARTLLGRANGAWFLTYGFLISATVTLVLTAGSPAAPLVFRSAIALSSAFGIALLLDLLRLRHRYREAVIPLAAASVMTLLFSVYVIVEYIVIVVEGRWPTFYPVLTRDINVIVATILLICALSTVLLIGRPGTTLELARPGFELVARDRLRRARVNGDEWWGMLDIRLDDTEDLRVAFGPSHFVRISEIFTAAVADTLPADADIHSPTDARVQVLIPRPPDRLRHLVPAILERISDAGTDSPLPVRISGSIGWAMVSLTGYDYETLVEAAADSVTEAQHRGGDRGLLAGTSESTETGPTRTARS